MRGVSFVVQELMSSEGSGERLTLYFMLKCESVKKKRDLESAFEVDFANHIQCTGDEYEPKE